METARDLARREETRHRRGLRLGVHTHAAHHVVGRRAHLHRRTGDVDVGQFHELVIHPGQLPRDLLGFAPRGDVEEGTAVGTPAALADLPRDGAGDDVAREELRRSPGLGLAPGHDVGHPAVRLRLVLGDVLAEHLRDVAEHEALALRVLEHAALAAHTLGDEDAAHAERPDHARGVKLDELHVDQVRTRIVGERVAVAGVLPGVAVDLVGAADAARRQHHRLGAEDDEAPRLAPVREGPAHPRSVLQQPRHRALHEHVDARGLHALVLERADHLEASAVADVGEPGILVAAEVALQDAAIGRPIEERSPGLELDHAGGRFLRQDLRHAPVVEHLPAAHRVAEVDLPAVAGVRVGERRRHPALGHHRVRLAEQRLAHEADRHALLGRLDRRAQPCTTGPDDEDVVGMGLVLVHHRPPRSAGGP